VNVPRVLMASRNVYKNTSIIAVLLRSSIILQSLHLQFYSSEYSDSCDNFFFIPKFVEHVCLKSNILLTWFS